MSTQSKIDKNKISKENLRIHEVYGPDDLPEWISRDQLAEFLHESLKPYEDTVEDIQKSFDYAFSHSEGKGGFILIGEIDKQPIGALVMLNTGMEGYVPGHILLFIAVDPSGRGKGIGAKIIKHGFNLCEGDVKLHVEYDNPAKRLYERLGMTSKYAEMRLTK